MLIPDHSASAFARNRLALALAAAIGIAAPLSCGAANAFDRFAGSDYLPDIETGQLLAVGNCADSGTGSLRGAIAAAASGDTIDLGQLGCSKITLTSGEIPVAVANLTIAGPNDKNLAIDAGAHSRIFNHTGSGKLTIRHLALAHGRIAPSSGNSEGGCIRSSGSVVLTDSSVSHCVAYSSNAFAEGGGVSAEGNIVLLFSRISGNIVHSPSISAQGGGVAAKGTINAKYSTIDANLAVADYGFFGNPPDGGGGGISTYGGSIRHTTISGNHAQFGGGVISHGLLDIENSTISGNEASVHVGGVLLLFSATISNSTIAFNHEGDKYGSGVFVRNDGSVDLQSTIIAMNTSGSSGGIDLGGGANVVVTGNDNLVRLAQISAPTGTLHDDPLLLPLADNGGVTKTHALKAASPALNRGNNAAALESDQRGPGYRREAGSTTDIGAYEFDDTIFVNGFDPSSG